MNKILSLLITLFCFPVFAQNSEAVNFKSSSKEDLELQKYLSLEATLSLEYRNDTLREMQNQNTTNIKEISIMFSMFESTDSKFVFEILGDKTAEDGSLNVNMGELYYQQQFSLFNSEDSGLNLGIMKLGYGILNPIDRMFSVLPSYYGYLYDLPRGLDTGIGVFTKLFSEDLTLSAHVFAGKNLRPADGKNRELDVAPHHVKLGWTPTKDMALSLNYFGRKYEGQPLVSGIGAEYKHQNVINFYGFNLEVDMEVWSISASLNSIANTALAGLIAPKLSFKNVFLQPYFSLERWSQDNADPATELFLTTKLGYNFNKNIQFLVEQTRIQNLTTDIYKENSFQARVVSQWIF